jgi:subtilase family serine protease
VLAVALLLSVVLAAGCTRSSGSPATTAPTGAAPTSALVSDCLLPPASCYLPYLFRVAYGIQPLLDRGIDGRGETVTVLDAAPPPSAAAPSATADMIAGLRLAVSGTDVASVNFGSGEHYFTKAQVAQMHSILDGAAAHHVTVVAGSGDNGGFSDDWFGGAPVKEVSLPASDPLVLAVGGTALTANPAGGAYVSETAWNNVALDAGVLGASGGGFSHLYARPAYQDGVPGIGTMRGVPDVAGDAALHGGAPIVFAGDGKRWIVSAGGTGASAPLWGGLVALADPYARHDLGFVNPAIYRIARSSSYHQAFHDVTTGNSYVTLAYPAGTAGYQAGPGWDPVTGWGSPDAQVLVPLLAA